MWNMKGKVKFECLGEDGLLILIRILNRCVVKFCTEFLVRNGPVNMTMDRLMIQNEVMSSGLLFFFIDLVLPSRSGWELRSSALLRIVQGWFITDVSGEPIDPIFKGQHPWPLNMRPVGCPETSVTNRHYIFKDQDHWLYEDGTCRLSWNVGN